MGVEKKDAFSQPGLFEALVERYPKFSRVTLCMVRNREYGVCLAPDAVSYLRKRGFIFPQKYRKAKKRVEMSINQDEYIRLKQMAEKEGCSMTELMKRRMFNG